MDIIEIISFLLQTRALNSTQYRALYNIMVFIGVIVVILVMAYILIGKEPEEEEF
ncbi:MAG: hypothetical protein GF329_21130 [Candidatus Lokiarchaeota archaeon]|nr:hypothetical protein [Candidatus Lokiarchaeota archaeon]